MTKPEDAKSLRGALVRGVLRLLLLGGLAVLALSWAGPDEPVGNRRFLWALAVLLLVVAAWGVVKTMREVNRLVHRSQ